MYSMLTTALLGCRAKIDSAFERVFKEQAGGAELVATLVIVGIVLTLALVFRDQIANLAASLWDNLVHGNNTQGAQTEIVDTWGGT